MIFKTFKKLLGNGRAWRMPIGFTSDFYDIIANSLNDVFKQIKNLKFTHFPTIFFDEKNIKNDEELFNNYNDGLSDEERAALTESNWAMLNGNLHYKELQNALKNAGFNIRIVENYLNSTDYANNFAYGTAVFGQSKNGKMTQYGGNPARLIGNGQLRIGEQATDPIRLTDGKNSFFVYGDFTPTETEWQTITNIILQVKPAQSVAICLIYAKI